MDTDWEIVFFKQHRDRVLRIINFAWFSDQKRDFNIDKGKTCIWVWTEGDWWLWGTFTEIPHPGRTWGEWRPVTTVKESRGNTVSYMENNRLNEWIVNEHLLWIKTKDRHSHPTPKPIWLYNTSQPNSWAFCCSQWSVCVGLSGSCIYCLWRHITQRVHKRGIEVKCFKFETQVERKAKMCCKFSSWIITWIQVKDKACGQSREPWKTVDGILATECAREMEEGQKQRVTGERRYL